jgi:hypothetical protein
MIQRAVAVAEARGGPDRFLNVGARAFDRVDECHALRKTAGDGGCKSTACSVRVSAFDAWRRKCPHALTVNEHVSN